MNELLLQQFADLPRNLSNHLKITVIPLALGVGISVPLAILVVRLKSLRYPVLTVVGVFQTIPSLALLALMVPILDALSGVTTRVAGIEIPALGFYPTVIALTIYSMLPILRNTVTGILGVDASLTEAARGVGMTDRQILTKVELPLAAPVILAGIRTATVWVVGTATLATPVGQTSLGNYIFVGLQTRTWIAVVFGCVAAAALAVLLDSLLGAVERATAERRRGLGIAALIGLALLFGGGLIAPQLERSIRALRDPESDSRPPVLIGSKTFTEQYILASLIHEVLSEQGFRTRRRENLGSTVGFDALRAGDIDLFVDYSGTIWANYMNREGSGTRQEVNQAVTRWLEEEHGIKPLGTLGFENAYALAMRRDQAEELGIRSIADLVEHAPELAIGGDYEFFGRPEWEALTSLYGLNFADLQTYDSTFMYEAIRTGQVDVISAFTTDGRIDSYDLVLLEDPRHAIPPYDALLLLSPPAAKRADLVRALEPLVGAIDVDLMKAANDMVDREDDKRTPAAAARFLRERIQQSLDAAPIEAEPEPDAAKAVGPDAERP